MRDWSGVLYSNVVDVQAQDAIATVNDYLYQINSAFGRLTKGQLPNSSGGTIVELLKDDYLYKPGLIGGQLAHGGVRASEFLTFSSTKHTTKGNIYLGSALSTMYDEANDRVGINVTPEVKLHVVGAPASGVTPWVYPGDPTLLGTGSFGWTSSVYGGANSFSSPSGTDLLWDSTINSEDDSAWISVGGVDADYPSQWTLPTMDSSVASWTIQAAARFSVGALGRGPGAFPGAGGHQLQIQFVDDAGDIWNFNIFDSVLVNNTWTYHEGTLLSGSPSGSGFTPHNRFRINANLAGGGLYNGIPAGSSMDVSWVRIVPTADIATIGGEPAVAIFKHDGDTDFNNTLWVDSSDVTVASVSAAGRGQFRDVSLEDDGSGFVITHAAPVLAASHTLTWPAAVVNTGILQVATGGTLSWTLPSALATRIDHQWAANGPFTVDTSVDGAWIAPHAFTITKTILWRGTAGSSGTTTVVLKRNGTTVDTRSLTAAGGSNTDDTSGVLSIAVAADDRLTIDTTTIEAGTPQHYTFEFEGA